MLHSNNSTLETSLLVIGGNDITTPELSTRHGYKSLPFNNSKYLTHILQCC